MADFSGYYPMNRETSGKSPLLRYNRNGRVATWLDIDDLTRYLKLPKSTIYKLFERGELPGYRVGRGLRFDQEEVDAAIKQTLRKRPKSEGGVHDARREPKSAS